MFMAGRRGRGAEMVKPVRRGRVVGALEGSGERMEEMLLPELLGSSSGLSGGLS